MIAAEPAPKPATKLSPAKAWMRAIELTANIAPNPKRTLLSVIEEWSNVAPDAPALISDRECMSYGALVERSNQYACWALQQGIRKGDVVGLRMVNRPEYMAIWLGLTRAGCTVALLNTNLTGSSLAHCVETVAPRFVITEPIKEVTNLAGDRLDAAECPLITIADLALYIYTSGTTGLPKAASISHARILQWSLWFAGILGVTPEDRLYNCLPMYHSVGGVVAMGAMLAGGGSVAIRETFSASRFWDDIARWDCTIFQYIGELCRRLLETEPNATETRHRVRVCCGNGLRADIWDRFQSRFAIPHVLEFYASTEGNVSLFNVEGKPGSIGRIPPYLAHRFQTELVRFDYETGEPARDESGFCIRCAANEAGEAIGRISAEPSNLGNRFEGYSNQGESRRKILRDVFKRGDAWFRTGDLMRRDEQGYFYFVDRVGDTFRWKGENVSTSEVEQVCCAFPGVTQANVYGVPVPGTDGRAGMAALAMAAEFDINAFHQHLAQHLPRYAQPLFLRIRDEMEMTETFKLLKSELIRDSYDPAATDDPIFLNDLARREFARIDRELYCRIQSGGVRL